MTMVQIVLTSLRQIRLQQQRKTKMESKKYKYRTVQQISKFINQLHFQEIWWNFTVSPIGKVKK